jgi:hypothetical protein
MGSWDVNTDHVEAWLLTLDEKTYLQVRAALAILAEVGPQQGRPLVDTITASKHSNMKELRPGSAGRSEIRILFAFDIERKAIMLYAGDKAGDWQRWYRKAIPVADALFDEHLAMLKKGKVNHG